MTLRILPAALAFLASPLAAQQAAANAKTYLDRIAALDDAGPNLNAVIAINADAPEQAAEAEAAGLLLAGRTVLVKDNIETRELPTTAGSLALAGNDTGRDAPLIANLRAAGGVVLGKANLSEWANFRSTNSTSGWSAVGGLTRNPHATDRNTCGSSSGSGAAVAAQLAWAAIGTETDGSIICPASINGVVGFKPTLGMVSRTHIVPLSASQDTAGPMARSVADAALLLTAIAGSDPADPATAEAANYLTDFTDGLETASLEGVRIGVLRNRVGPREDVKDLFEAALADMEAAGAVLVDIEVETDDSMYNDEYTVLLYEFRRDIAPYLQSLPGDGFPRDLAGLIASNSANTPEELRWFGQEIFTLALETTDEEAYRTARVNSLRLAGEDGIDALLARHDVAILVAPSQGPAWPSDLVNGDHFTGGYGLGSYAAIAGYPHLTVPMGAVERLPVGLSFIGGKWDDHAILKAGAAYERVRSGVLAEPGYEAWSP